MIVNIVRIFEIIIYYWLVFLRKILFSLNYKNRAYILLSLYKLYINQVLLIFNCN